VTRAGAVAAALAGYAILGRTFAPAPATTATVTGATVEVLYTFALALVVLNSAVGLDAIVVNAVLGGGAVANLWIYLVGPLVGGALAAGVFGLQEQEPISMHSKASRTPEKTPV
jgi:glycerol uptake facilitator-like aquaporin